jgi:hypothetical protein
MSTPTTCGRSSRNFAGACIKAVTARIGVIRALNRHRAKAETRLKSKNPASEAVRREREEEWR